MKGFNHLSNRQRVTQAQKDANGGAWYKEQAMTLDHHGSNTSNFIGFGGVDNYTRKKVNYDLFNNIIDKRAFEHVIKPFGAETGDLPANFENRDIISGKIKVLLGMEMEMPFSWKVVAVNEEATTRKEEEEFGRIRDFVTSEIMTPIEQAIQKQIIEQQKGKELTPDEKQQLEQQVAQEKQAQTPDQVRKYMARKHQDPAEIMSHQILEYLIQKEKVNDKFNKGWKHSNISGEEVYWVGIINGEPSLKVINPLYFDYDKSPDLDYIEDGEWARYEYRMTPSEVVSQFGRELKTNELDRLYQFNQNGASESDIDPTFTFDDNAGIDEPYTIRVVHLTWKGLRKIGFLSYFDQRTGKSQEKIIDESYRLNPEQGDLKIKWEWIPECHEVYKILNDIFVYGRPVPGQHRDLDNLYECKLPYYGAACDSLNSPTTSPMDRMKSYQYFYDILIYRVELLMASDKGKILAAYIDHIPKSAGVKTDQFVYFMEANHIAFFNKKEEGNRGSSGNGMSIGDMVKEIDMSLATQISQYIELAEYIERKCGESVGITKAMEGSASPQESVGNNRQNLMQASHIIKPYFELHNIVKGNVLTALLEIAKVAYSTGKPKKLSYVLDDLSMRMLTVDQGLLAASTLGLFVSNSGKADNAKKAVEQLAQAALQNQQASLLDIVKIIRSESVTEVEELLTIAADKASEQAQAIEKQKMDGQDAISRREDQRVRDEWAHDLDMVDKKGEWDYKIKTKVAAMGAMGFDPNKDQDGDGEPDVLEVYKTGVDADIKMKKQALDEAKFGHQQKQDAIGNKQAEQKLKIDEKKANKPASGA